MSDDKVNEPPNDDKPTTPPTPPPTAPAAPAQPATVGDDLKTLIEGLPDRITNALQEAFKKAEPPKPKDQPTNEPKTTAPAEPDKKEHWFYRKWS